MAVFGWAVAGEETLTRELEREAQAILDRAEDDPAAVISDIELSPSGRAVHEDPAVQETLRASTREMLAQGVGGWVDDDLAFVTASGFAVGELHAPSRSAGATDVLVPAAHGAWLAGHIPRATA